MTQELRLVLTALPRGSEAQTYRESILQQNILGKATDSTRHKSFRHLRELYGLDENVSIFALLRALYEFDPSSLPLLALQVAWARDPLLRATTRPVFEAAVDESVEPASLAQALEVEFPNHYSELVRKKIARNAAASWTQSGHLVGRTTKVRQRIQPTSVAVALAMFLGSIAGYLGAAVFSNPWCKLLDLNPVRARAFGVEAHRAGLIDLRMVGEVIELSFPRFPAFEDGKR